MGSEWIAVTIWLAGMPVMWLATLDDTGAFRSASLWRFTALALLWPLFGLFLWAMAGSDLCVAIVKLARRSAPGERPEE